SGGVGAAMRVARVAAAGEEVERLRRVQGFADGQLIRRSAGSRLVFGLPGLAYLVRPVVIAAPAVHRVVERGALARHFRADARQPLLVRVPSFSLGCVGLALVASVRGTAMIKRRTKLVGFLVAHRS